MARSGRGVKRVENQTLDIAENTNSWQQLVLNLSQGGFGVRLVETHKC